MASSSRQVRNSSPSSSLIAAHCSTIRRKIARIDIQELTGILNDLVRELAGKNTSRPAYLNSLNEIIQALNSHSSAALLSISSHYFFVLVRNALRDLLGKLLKKFQLNLNEIYVLRNCVLLFETIVKNIENVSKILHWLTELSFIDTFGQCLNEMQSILKANNNKRILKQLARLLNLFANIQERLPLDSHQNYFVRLLQPTINNLTSLTFQELFRNLKFNASSLTAKEKFYLIKCPYFITSYNGKTIENLSCFP
jgi:hypothetical protein